MGKRFFKGFLVLLLAISFMTLPVKADEVLTTTSANDVITETIFEADDELHYSKNVFGSAFIAGNNVTVGGNIDGALFLAGNNIKHNGTTEYAAIAGNMIEVSGTYLKDVAIAGNIISVRNEARFARDVVIMGSEVTISGVVDRDIAIYAETINLENVTIKGSASIYADRINISESSKINGNLETNLEVDAKYVDGKITINELPEIDYEISMQTIILGKVISYVSLLVTFVVLFLLFPKMFKVAKDTEFEAGKLFALAGTGIICLVFVPVVSIILMITSIGFALSLIALLVYGISIYLSNIYTGYYVGKCIWEKGFKKNENELVHSLIGITLLFVLELIPYIGGLVGFASLLVGLGLIFKTMRK